MSTRKIQFYSYRLFLQSLDIQIFIYLTQVSDNGSSRNVHVHHQTRVAASFEGTKLKQKCTSFVETSLNEVIGCIYVFVRNGILLELNGKKPNWYAPLSTCNHNKYITELAYQSSTSLRSPPLC